MHLMMVVIVAMLSSIVAVAPGYGAQPDTLVASRSDLTGTMPLPLTGKRRAAFEAYITGALYRFGVPGAAIVVVQNGDVVYLNGFGGATVNFTGGAEESRMTITVPASVTGPEQAFMFRPRR